MSDDKPIFYGFPLPEQNWSKLPHLMIDALPLVTSMSELKVILYILRHTWGFQEFGLDKKITVDEFIDGRKRKDRTRMDHGTGLSKPSVIDGLRRAEKHGFIRVSVDDHDQGRVKKFYSLVMQGSNSFTPGVKDLYSNSQGSLHRTEKDTLERNLSKIWSSVLSEIGAIVSRSVFSQRYQHTRLVSLNDARAEVQCGDVGWFDVHGRAVIEERLSAVAGRPVAVRFV